MDGDVMTADEEYIERRDRIRAENSTVRAPIGRMDKSLGRRNKGTVKKYTPTRMVNAINKYFDQCEKRDEIPSAAGLTLFLKMSPSMFYTYLKYPDFTEIMESARFLIAEWIGRDIYNTSGPAAGKIAYAKNILGWAEQINTKNETEIKQTISVGEATAKIEQFAPKLLAMIKNNPEMMRQLAAPDTQDAEIVEEKK